MIFQFDAQALEIRVLCGPKETYAPDAAAIELAEKMEALKQKVNAYHEQEVRPILIEINDAVVAMNSKNAAAAVVPAADEVNPVD